MTKQTPNTKSASAEGANGRDTGAGLATKSHEVAEQVRHVTLERVEAARQSVQSAKDHAAEGVRKLGATVRKVGEHLRVEDQRYIADRATDASQRLDGLASYLSSAELATVLRDTSAIARSKPALFFGGAFLTGLAAGRFLKSTGSSASAQGGSETMRGHASK